MRFSCTMDGLYDSKTLLGIILIAYSISVLHSGHTDMAEPSRSIVTG